MKYLLLAFQLSLISMDCENMEKNELRYYGDDLRIIPDNNETVLTIDSSGVAHIPVGWQSIIVIRNNKLWSIDSSNNVSVPR